MKRLLDFSPPSSLTRQQEDALLFPEDQYNRELLANVRPPGWANPSPADRYNLVVIGGGTAGLVAAVGAASLGARVALIEKHLLGGDCLNYGCVPSKGLLRAARAVYAVQDAAAFGVQVAGPVEIDFAAVMQRMRRLRAKISHHDSAARLTNLGVDVFVGQARFTGGDTVDVDGCRLRFARAIIATGSRPATLPVAGLHQAGFLTNETVFSLTELPRRLVVIGAGPIGCELAQAFRRFGSEVTIVSLDPQLLPREDTVAADILRAQFEREGIRLALGARILRVERGVQGKRVVFQRGEAEESVYADEILLAIGRAPNVEGLELGAAGVAFDQTGVLVDDHLRTTNPRVFAAGDVCSAYKFTHAADAMARIALQNALFFGRKKASALVIPWCTYTDPEVAHVGLSAKEAEARGLQVTTVAVPLADVHRALLDGDEEGFARVLATKGGRILGATLVARHAGEMIGELSLAITAGLSLVDLSKTIHPYPTQAEVWKRLGDAYQKTRLTPRVHLVLERFLQWRR